MGNNEIAAFNIAYKIIYMVHQFGLSVGIGTNVRVSMMLGAGDVVGAKRSRYVKLRWKFYDVPAGAVSCRVRRLGSWRRVRKV